MHDTWTPNSTTLTSEDPYNRHCLPLAVITLLIAICASLSNALLLRAIYSNPYQNLRTASSMLVTNLAVTDLLSAVVAGYGTFAFELYNHMRWTFSQSALIAVIVASALAIVCGTCCVVLMAIDRYLAIQMPIYYVSIVTPTRMKIAIAATWVYTFVFNTLPLAGVNKELYGFISSHLHVTIPAFILSMAYIRVLLAYRRQKRTWSRSENSTADGRVPVLAKPQQTVRERKFTSAILINIGCFYLSFLPHYIALNIIYCLPMLRKSPGLEVFIEVGFIVLLSNSLINPCIYALRVAKYRRALRYTLGLRNTVNVIPAL